MVNGNTLNINSIRLSEDNQNLYEAIKGQWGQFGDKKAAFTIIKNILFINLFNGAVYKSLKLPFDVYDGFIQCSNGSRIQVNDSTLTCSLPSDVNGFGIFVIKKWN